MAVDIRLSGLGESIAEGTIVKWLKQPGEAVRRDEDLVVVATDKIEMEIPSLYAGTVTELLANVGDTVKVGAVIARLDNVPGKGSPQPPAAPAAAPTETALSRVAPPRSSPAIANAAPAGLSIEERNARARQGDRKLFVSPAVRRLAREHDLDLSALEGTGEFGRITARDVARFLAEGGAGSGFAAPPKGYAPGQTIPQGGFARRVVAPFDPSTPARFAPTVEDGDAVEPLAGPSRLLAEHMAYTSWRAAHVGTLVEIDMKRVADDRSARRGQFAPPSYTLYVLWAVVQALKAHSSFNASLTHDLRRIVHARVHLGTAVARADGSLVVPVIRDAGSMTFDQLGAAYADLVERAKGGRITATELQGGTFTVSNVGSNGNLASWPLINQPQVAILAMGAVTKRPVVAADADGNDVIAIRPRMYATLQYDHRANDGARSGAFLRDLRGTLERWRGPA